MAKVKELGLECSLAWWWWPYFYGVLTFVWITGLEPNMDKVYAKLFKAVRIRYVGGRRWRNLLDVGE